MGCCSFVGLFFVVVYLFVVVVFWGRGQCIITYKVLHALSMVINSAFPKRCLHGCFRRFLSERKWREIVFRANHCGEKQNVK